MVRQIAEVFEAEDVMPIEDYAGNESGARRFEAGRHEAALDLTTETGNLTVARISRSDHRVRSGLAGSMGTSTQALISSLMHDGAPVNQQGNLTGEFPRPASTAAIDPIDLALLAKPEVAEAHTDDQLDALSNKYGYPPYPARSLRRWSLPDGRIEAGPGSRPTLIK